MSSNSLLIISFIFISIIASGALGLKSENDCEGLSRHNGAMECLHTLAISQAYYGVENEARDTCLDIYTTYGVPYSDDASRRAELETNNCIYDIARILAKPGLCTYITESESALSTGLFGEETNEKMCREAATKAAKLKPENYYESDLYDNSICALMFVLPLILIGASRMQGRA